jgi:hypothetical protein
LQILTKVKIEKWKIALVPTVLSILLLAIAYSYPESRIRVEDMAARQELFSPSLNRELQRLISDDPDILILTNYPVEYVLGLENSQISFWYADAQEFERLIQSEKITHLLVPSTAVNAEILDQIEQMVIDGELTFLLQDQGSSVIPYRLYAFRR